MKKKTANLGAQLTWNPASKESWHHEFDKEPVNDDKWTCIVVAVVPSKVEDDECIQMFNRSVATGRRKSIRVVTPSDVSKVLHEAVTPEGKGNAAKKSKNEKVGLREEPSAKRFEPLPPPPKQRPIVNLAAKYVTGTETELKLPPDLMAALLKHIILNIKEENVFRKKVDAVKERKMRERNVKVNFIKSMRPFKASLGESSPAKDKSLPTEPEPINDEPYPGPDLYIVLSDFYDPLCFPELLDIHVPFVAILKISHFKEMAMGKFSQTTLSSLGKPEILARKENLVSNFWKILAEKCSVMETSTRFQDFIFMQYQPQALRTVEMVQNVRDAIFDELSLTLYSVFGIYRQHQTYLQEMHVQRVIVSQKPLDLSECQVYNNLCERFVFTEPTALLLVLYAIVEQVAVGIPPADNLFFEYEPKPSSYFLNPTEFHMTSSSKNDENKSKIEKLTPCLACRQKKVNEPQLICRHLSNETPPMRYERLKESKMYKKTEPKEEDTLAEDSVQIDDGTPYIDQTAPESFHDLPMKTDSNKSTKDSNWTSPIPCFYGDKLTFYTCHTKWKAADMEELIDRFFRKIDLLKIWSKHPIMPPEKRVYYKYHFQRLLTFTKENRDLLRIKIFFVLSMHIIGITKSYLYKGEEENISDVSTSTIRDKSKKYSKVKFDEHGDSREERRDMKNFSFCFFRLFSPSKQAQMKASESTKKADKQEKPKGSIFKDESPAVRKVASIFNIPLVSHGYSDYCWSPILKTPSRISLVHGDPKLTTLHSLLDCYEIFNLSEPHMISQTEDCLNLVKNFNFYEALEPKRMVQRILQAQESFNTTQCSYFSPTDTMIVTLHNESDHRGIFFTLVYGYLPTPVCLRDFYGHLYPEISEWLASEKKEFLKFSEKIKEEKKEITLIQNKKTLSKLKKDFKAMNDVQKEEFLNIEVNDLKPVNLREVEVSENELEDLPVKPKPEYPTKKSFITTNLPEVRMETKRKIHEFHSRDGTQINLYIDSWLHDPTQLLTLQIQQTRFRLWYHHLMSEKQNTMFILKTTSDIILVFHKDTVKEEDSGEKYQVKISWPTGLMVESIVHNESNIWIKQYYLKNANNSCNSDGERCRYFLKNGQVLVFNDNGKLEILCSSGIKHVAKVVRGFPEGWPLDVDSFETTTMTGQVWEKKQSGRNLCQIKRKVTDTMKVFIGVDPKTQETYYRREDGVSCMLWPNGKLVTCFPDATKITSTPDFDQEEVVVEWTEEEKLYFGNLESSRREGMEESRPKSKTILKRPSPDSLPEKSNSFSASENSEENDGFVSISVSYLMEHPKYSSVRHDSQSPEVEVNMPDQLSVKIHPDGTYLVSQENQFLSVKVDSAKMYSICPGCNDRSSALIRFDSGDILSEFVDLHHVTYYVYKNGETVHQEHMESIDRSETNNSCNYLCKLEHNKSLSEKHRCFALERDLSGIEFLHSECLARDFYRFPEDTLYNLHKKGNVSPVLTHIFSVPYHRVGYEAWTMDYEVNDNSMPTNLKRKDLKELGTKDNSLKLFKYPFTRNPDAKCKNESPKLGVKKLKMPKLIVTRVVKCLSDNPKTIIDELKAHVGNYQKKAYDILKDYKDHETLSECSIDNSKQIKENLNKIQLPTDPWLVMNDFQVSTDADIHRSGHYLNLMSELKSTRDYAPADWPQCKQIATIPSALKSITTIHEEDESLENEM